VSRHGARPSLFLALAVGLASALGAATAAADGVLGLRFESGPVAFSSEAIAFPSEAVAFPGGPAQTETAATIEVTLPADILFDFDKADIRPTAQQPLHEVAELVRQKARGPVVIQGYTDALGSDAHNQKLSERRAASVRTWLVTHEGLSSVHFTTIGFGPRNPVAPNRRPDGSDDPDGRQLNRRVTLIIRK
jgi:outer membrane protein OmpA-like peptidoglycan-associated protein